MDYRQTVDLGGSDWELGAAPHGGLPTSDSKTASLNADGLPTRLTVWDIDAVPEWLPAVVPGDVRADLLAVGRIPDPFVGLANQESQWVDEHDWWYRKQFSHTLADDERAFLVFHGVDYMAAIYLDGQLLGCHEGMFSRQIYEVTSLLRTPSESHQVAVRLLGPAHFPVRQLSWLEQLWDRFSARLLPGERAFPERLNFLKCQMGYGWDFAPRLRTIGLWDDVELIVVRAVWICDVRIRTDLHKGNAALHLDIELDAARPVSADIQIELRDRATGQAVTTRSLDAALSAGAHHVTATLDVTQPKLWQPWDRGEPHLYEIIVRVSGHGNGDSGALDAYRQTLGIRDIALRSPAEDPAAEPWVFYINGQREFIRGANWVPLDAMPGRLRCADYETMLEQVRAAGVNLLRVWGGGLREKTAFYDLCDQKGILVWQDFPFACAFLGHFRRDVAFLDLAHHECTEIVRQLRHHPSLVLWCGGNEFSARRNRRLVGLLRAIVAEEDGERPFKPVSPTRGEAHNWRVWHGKAAVSHYRRDESAMLSEFGLQAAPDVESLRRFLPAKDLWPPGAAWAYHNAAMPKLFRYARPCLPPEIASLADLSKWQAPDAVEAFVAATQRAQAHGLQVAIEHVRRRKGQTGGVIFWQLNEPWPSICWSVIDRYGRPKQAYHKLVQVYNPVLLSALYPLRRLQAGDRLEMELWAINDLTEPVEGARAEAILDDEIIFQGETSLPPDSSRPIGRVSHLLKRSPQRLELRLTCQTGKRLYTNEYDLTYDPPPGIAWRNYLNARLAELLLRW